MCTAIILLVSSLVALCVRCFGKKRTANAADAPVRRPLSERLADRFCPSRRASLRNTTGSRRSMEKHDDD